METKKFRIGNDIRLAVDLRQYLDKNNNLREREVYNPEDSGYENIDDNPYVNKAYEVYYPNQYDNNNGNSAWFSKSGSRISIRSVKAIFVNATRKKQYEDDIKKKTRFISRFPIEPIVDAFHATPYDICVSGYPTWRAYPRRHGFLPYHGFGVYPEWGGIYKPLPIINDIEYRANVAATEHQNVVEVSFPAEHQLHTGVYNLILVVKVYAPGFNNKNLKTITIDLPAVIELVKTSKEGVDSDIDATWGNVVDVLPYSYPYLMENKMYDPESQSFYNIDTNDIVNPKELYHESADDSNMTENQLYS